MKKWQIQRWFLKKNNRKTHKFYWEIQAFSCTSYKHHLNEIKKTLKKKIVKNIWNFYEWRKQKVEDLCQKNIFPRLVTNRKDSPVHVIIIIFIEISNFSFEAFPDFLLYLYINIDFSSFFVQLFSIH